MISLNYLLSSSLFRMFWDRMSRFFGQPKSASSGDAEILSTKSGSITERTQYRILVFTLSLCFAFASLAYASSLLTFSPSRFGTAFCGMFHNVSFFWPLSRHVLSAFVVAFGGMASQVARLAGLTILILELRMLEIVWWEHLLQSACLFIGAGRSDLRPTSNAHCYARRSYYCFQRPKFWCHDVITLIDFGNFILTTFIEPSHNLGKRFAIEDSASLVTSFPSLLMS
jgi:hypothetical protein